MPRNSFHNCRWANMIHHSVFCHLSYSGQLIWEIFDKDWNSSDAFCKIFKFCQTLGITSSTYMLVAVSLDRLWAIVYPLNTHPSAGRYSDKVHTIILLKKSRLAATTWVLSIFPCLPNLYMFNTVTDTSLPVHKTTCVSKWAELLILLFPLQWIFPRLYSNPEEYGELFRKIYFLIVIIVVFIIPFFLIISFYVRILLTLCRQFCR